MAKSDLPNAKKFQNWMANVIVELCRNGEYKLQQSNEIENKLIKCCYQQTPVKQDCDKFVTRKNVELTGDQVISSASNSSTKLVVGGVNAPRPDSDCVHEDKNQIQEYGHYLAYGVSGVKPRDVTNLRKTNCVHKNNCKTYNLGCHNSDKLVPNKVLTYGQYLARGVM